MCVFMYTYSTRNVVTQAESTLDFLKMYFILSEWGIEVQLYSFFNLGMRWGRAVKATFRPL